MWIIQGLVALYIVLCTQGIVLAEVTHDIRVKIGSASGIDKLESSSVGLNKSVDPGDGGNLQVEYAITVGGRSSAVAFVGTAGIFSRQHSGKVLDPVLPTDIKYNAAGLSGSAGISIKANTNLHFEGRAGLDLGAGKPSLSTPGFAWTDIESGGYAAFSLIGGAYYAYSRPGMLLGLELGMQSFAGDFKIWNNGGYWTDATVSGSSVVANLVLGVRF